MFLFNSIWYVLCLKSQNVLMNISFFLFHSKIEVNPIKITTFFVCLIIHLLYNLFLYIFIILFSLSYSMFVYLSAAKAIQALYIAYMYVLQQQLISIFFLIELGHLMQIIYYGQRNIQDCMTVHSFQQPRNMSSTIIMFCGKRSHTKTSQSKYN